MIHSTKQHGNFLLINWLLKHELKWLNRILIRFPVNTIHLNIDVYSNALDFDLAKSVGEYFQLTKPEMDSILKEVKSVVSQWKMHAKHIGISLKEQELMAQAFNY